METIDLIVLMTLMVIVYIIIAVLKCVHHFNERKHWSQIQEIENVPTDLQNQNVNRIIPNQTQEQGGSRTNNLMDQNSENSVNEPGFEPPPSYEDVMNKEQKYCIVSSAPPPSYAELTSMKQD